MRLALDLTPAVKSQRTGVGWYAAALAEALGRALPPHDELWLCTRLSRWRLRRHRPVVAGARVRHRWFQAPFGPLGGADVFHGTDARLPERTRATLVATVHDVFSLQSDQWADSRFRSRREAQYADIAERAQRVVFSSSATRDAYLERFPAARDRSAVVHLGVPADLRAPPPERVAEARRRYALPESYALYVGEISARKNLPGMARGLVASATELPWVWVGRPSYGAEDIEREIARAGAPEVIRRGYVPAEDLAALYAGARMLLFATLSEGFGLPAVEAMACGTPAVVADRGALPEVCAGCALEADPGDPAALGDIIRRLAEDDALHADLRRRGLARARDLTWDHTAQRMLEIYRELL